MSYILGALKRAEKERTRDKPVSLTEWNQDDWDQLQSQNKKGSSRLILWLVSFTLVAILMIFAGLAYKIMLAAPEQPLSSASDSQIQSADQRVDQGAERPSEAESVQVRPTQVTPVFVDSNSADIPDELALNSGNSLAEIQARPELPEFSGHMYFPNSAQLSRVFSGTSAYRQGEMVEGYLIEEIGEAEVVLSFRGVEYRVELER